jgi:O-antigen ligase
VWAVSALERLTRFHRQNPEEFYFCGLFWSFWTTLALYPIGYGFREVMPPLSLLFLLGYYRHARSRCVAARLNVFPLFYCLWAMLCIGVFLSEHLWASLLHAGTGVNKGFILPFIAMECVREEKDLRRLIWACVLACFWQGLDALWQFHSGRDFIMGYPLNDGRLTGSLGDYAVGNYIALALIPAFGLWFILREKLDAVASAFLLLAALWPALFLLLGAAARAGMLAVAFGLALWPALKKGFEQPRACLWFPVTGIAALAFFFVVSPRQKILDAAAVAGDGRWSLWELAWRIFCEHPWFGAGAGQYNTAFRALGLAPARDAITISHPHNLFLDLLYAHGLVGFSLGMVFLFGFLIWGFRRIRANLAAGWKDRLYWRLAAAFWIAYASWFANGLFGHDFYRTWWLGLAMSYLGVMAGAVVNGDSRGFRSHG